MTAPPRVWKHLAAAFGITLVGYILIFHWIENRRVKKGPWEVTFQSAEGRLELVINQPAFAIQGVRIALAGTPIETNLLQTVRFTAGRPVPFEVPGGRCVFLDPLFLPGKVVLEITGHEIQLMPRVLIVDGREHSWATTSQLQLGEK